MNAPDPLDVALAAQRPIATDREELEIERLIPPHQRLVTVDDHAAFRAGLAAELHEPEPEAKP